MYQKIFGFSKPTKDELYAAVDTNPELPEKYKDFISCNPNYDENNIREFAESINRDPGIVLGRLMIDGKVNHSDTYLSKKLRHNYNVVMA